MAASPAVKVEVKVEEETEDRKRKSPPISTANAKNAKVKIEPEDDDKNNIKKEDDSSETVNQFGFSMELKLDAASALRSALQTLRVPEIGGCHLETFPNQLCIKVKKRNGLLLALLQLLPSACTVFKCTKSYTLILDFEKLYDAVCNPDQSEQGIIRINIGDIKVPIIVQSGTNNTTFHVEVITTPVSTTTNTTSNKSDKSNKTDPNKKDDVQAVFTLSSGFFKSILHSMKEMVAAYSTQDMNNMVIDIRITAEMVKLTAFGVDYHMKQEEKHYTTTNYKENEEYHVSFPLNELENYIQGTENSKSVMLYVNHKWRPRLTFNSGGIYVNFYGTYIPSATR